MLFRKSRRIELKLTQKELHILLQSMNHLRNCLIQEGRCTDVVDEFLAKFIV